ncbi:MAG: pyridoxal-phosphate dependent enzyme [Pirellulales bacterium]|nr:pyridoxal-phosphate dependent enzyme [Pirellulales bacterium]
MNPEQRNGVSIVAIQGSVRPGNFTAKALALTVDEVKKNEIAVELVDPSSLNLTLPGVPNDSDDPQKLQALVKEATGVILSTPFEYAQERAAADGLHMLPSFHPLLVRGVGTYALELFRAAGDLDTVYVPIGLGSGICGVISARDALGLGTAVVGVVAEGAPCYALSFEAERPVSTNNADTMADGLAVRVPDPEAVATILRGADRIVAVSDDEIKSAMRHYFTDTHNVAEGAGAATLAAALREKREIAGKRVGLILSGGNVDMDVYRQILAES